MLRFLRFRVRSSTRYDGSRKSLEVVFAESTPRGPVTFIDPEKGTLRLTEVRAVECLGDVTEGNGVLKCSTPQGSCGHKVHVVVELVALEIFDSEAGRLPLRGRRRDMAAPPRVGGTFCTTGATSAQRFSFPPEARTSQDVRQAAANLPDQPLAWGRLARACWPRAASASCSRAQSSPTVHRMAQENVDDELVGLRWQRMQKAGCCRLCRLSIWRGLAVKYCPRGQLLATLG